MIYIMSGCLIFGTHYLLKENQLLIQRRLWQLILGAILFIGVAAMVSTWIGSLIPVVVVTLICATMLQIKYTYQINSR